MKRKDDKQQRYAPVVSPGGGGSMGGSSITINSTNGVIPYRVDATTFGDSPIARSGAGAITVTGTQINTSAAASAFVVGANGDTNPILRVVANVASVATGLSITGNAAGSGVTLTALSSGTDESIIAIPKGAGVWEQRSGTTAQVFRIYQSFTDASNYTRAELAWITGDKLSLRNNQAAGSGASNRSMEIRSGGILDVIATAGAVFIIPTAGSASLAVRDNQVNIGTTEDVGFTRRAANVLRLNNNSTGAGSLIIGTSAGAIGTSGAGVLAFTLSTEPSTSPADTVQLYSKDWNGAGTATLHVRNEEGHIFIYKKSAAYTPTNVSADRSFDADTVAVAELADVVGTLIADLQANGLLA